MIKLMLTDFDGTLLPYGQKEVSQASIDAIKALLSKGIKVAVASGRTYSELTALLKEVADRIWFICDDGALTVYGGNVIFRKPIPKDSLKTFFDSDIFKSVTFYSLGKAYLLGCDNAPVLYGKTPCKISRHIELTDEIYKVTATAKCFDLVSNNKLRVHYSEGLFAEFVSAYANKGVATADLQLKLGISKFETAAIGDADNDLPMMSHAKYSWCIGDRSVALKSKCLSCADTAQSVLLELTNNI